MNYIYNSDLTVDEAVQQWMIAWNPYLLKQGYKPVAQTASAISYSGKYLTLARFILGLLTFPVGILIWFFAKKEQGITVSFGPADDGSRWRLSGQAIGRVRSMFLRSGFQLDNEKAPHGGGA